MASTIISLALALAAGSAGWQDQIPVVRATPSHSLGAVIPPGGRILGPGPGFGWGFRNGNPDGYGWFDHGTALPLGADRVSEYYFPRYHSLPPNQMFLPSYYNPYVTRGQRYLAFSGGGGAHPAGGPPLSSSDTPTNPYQATIGSGPRVAVPVFNGRVLAPPIPSGATGLTP